MKSLAPKVAVVEVDGEGLIGFLGKRITLFCDTYIYTGDVIGVNDSYVKLENAGIVYETGSFSSDGWKDYQPLPTVIYVQIGKIEAFGKVK